MPPLMSIYSAASVYKKMVYKRIVFEYNCTKAVANVEKATHLRPFSCIILDGLKKKKYLCGISYEQIIKMV